MCFGVLSSEVVDYFIFGRSSLIFSLLGKIVRTRSFLLWCKYFSILTQGNIKLIREECAYLLVLVDTHVPIQTYKVYDIRVHACSKIKHLNAEVHYLATFLESNYLFCAGRELPAGPPLRYYVNSCYLQGFYFSF